MPEYTKADLEMAESGLWSAHEQGDPRFISAWANFAQQISDGLEKQTVGPDRPWNEV